MDIDVATGMPKGEPRELYRARTDRGGGWQIREPVWSPDRTMLAMVLQDSGWDKVYLIATSGGPSRPLTDGESEDAHRRFSRPTAKCWRSRPTAVSPKSGTSGWDDRKH
jgi:hypothetical protein